MKSISLVGIAFACLAALLFWSLKGPNLPGIDSDRAAPVSTLASQAARPSPFDIVEQDSDISVIPVQEPADSETIVAVEQRLTPEELSSVTIPNWQSIRSEAELLELIDAINADPALLQLLMDHYRQELDPDLRKKLSSILGLVGGEQVTLLASELIFSGDSAQRTEGMDLLQAVQPGNPMAREIVSGMLSTEVEPDVLIDALTALAQPGSVDAQSRALLSEQVSLLANHDDESVRGISLDILSRWTDGSAYTDVFVAALDDVSRHVRAAAVYALHDHVENPTLVAARLFSVLENTGEHPRVRSAALLSLKSQSLSPAQRDQLERLEVELNTRPKR